MAIDPADRRTHIERINDLQEDGAMTDAQVADLKAHLTELFNPVVKLAEKQLLLLAAQEAQAAAAAIDGGEQTAETQAAATSADSLPGA